MNFTATHRLYGLGVILLGAMTVCARHFSERGSPSFLIPLLIAGIAYLLAVRELFFAQKLPKHLIIFGFALAAFWHLLYLFQAPGQDDDIHRYVWDGRVQRFGYNPYLVIPDDPTMAGLHTAETRTLNNAYLPSPYPPGAELFFRAVTAIHESTFALKVVFVLCDFTIAVLLFAALRHSQQGAHWVLAYAWQPLLAIEVAGSGHVDILGALLLLLSALALWRRWRPIAAVAFGLAVAVKFLPIVLVPLYWKRVRVRDVALGIFAVGLLYLPFLNHGRIATGSLGTYVRSFRFNGPLFAVLEPVMSRTALAGTALLAGFVVAIWYRKGFAELSADAFAWPMAASLFCAPVVYPWYLLWLLPFLRSVATLPLIIWTVSIIPTYYVWHLRATGHLWILPDWVMAVEYGAVVVGYLAVASRRLRASSPTKVSAD